MPGLLVLDRQGQHEAMGLGHFGKEWGGGGRGRMGKDERKCGGEEDTVTLGLWIREP